MRPVPHFPYATLLLRQPCGIPRRTIRESSRFKQSLHYLCKQVELLFRGIMTAILDAVPLRRTLHRITVSKRQTVYHKLNVILDF